jgi:hypothetical protein
MLMSSVEQAAELSDAGPAEPLTALEEPEKETPSHIRLVHS